MLQAAKFGDLVLGVDMHHVMVPAPPSPVPAMLPHLFTGTVFDPLGLGIAAACTVAGSGGLVLINGSPVANTGTDVDGEPHAPSPPAVSFAPDDVPDHKGTIVTGSKTVSLGGAAAARLSSLASSCGYPLNLPTSICLAVAAGAPVLIGGPDTFDVASAVTRGLRTKWFSNQLHKILKPGKRLSKAICLLTGHPVDVMTGEVVTDAVDFDLPGPLPLAFERSYFSRHREAGALGPGWHHPLDAAVHEVERRVGADGVRGLKVRLPDGRESPHKALAAGESIWDEIDRYTLERAGRGYRLTFWDGLRLHFEPVPGANATHPLVRMTDRSDNTIALRHDAGRLAEVKDSAGRALRFDHEGGRLRSIRLKEGREEGGGAAWIELVRYEYDAEGRLAAAVDRRGHATRYAYRGGVLIRETDKNGLSFHFKYDWHHPDGRCVHTWGDGGIYERRITYDEYRHIAVVDDGRGGRTHYSGNAAGLVERVLDPMGVETRTAWDPACRKVAETDGLGGRTEWAYDDRGNPILERDPLGNETRCRYDALNLPVEHVDAGGGVWRFGYDARGKIARIVDPLGEVTRLLHDRRGNLVSVEDARGARREARYTEEGLLEAVTDAEGHTTRVLLDALGRVASLVDPLGGETLLSRDACGNPVQIRRPDGSILRRAYDPEGNLVELTDALGNTTRLRYAGFNRLVERIDPAGGVVRLAYDLEEDLVEVTNEIGERYRIERDRAGRVAKEIGFDGRTFVLWHDRAGRLREVVNGRSKPTKIERDAKGRIVKLHVTGLVPPGKVLPGVETIELAYDALDRVIGAKGAAAEIALERDALGRIVAERSGDHAVESAYDPAGHRARRRTSLGHEARYDAGGEGALLGLTCAVDPRFGDFSYDALAQGGPVRAPWEAILERDALGNETARRLPSGVVRRWGRDRAGRPESHRVLRDGAEILAIGYVWRSYEQIAALIDPGEGATWFAHDARSYLVAATRPDGRAQHRLANEAGAIYRAPDWSDRSYGTGGRLMEAGGLRYLYDDDGQPIERVMPEGPRWRYRWDGQGQLVEVTRPDGKKVTFAYDPLGRRIRKTFEGRTTIYVWDGDQLVHEVTEGEPPVTWEMEPGTFAPMAKLEGERRYAVVTDHLGAPALLLDEAGEIAWKGRLDLYGAAEIEVARTKCPWRWPGQYEDEETGLYYNRFRYYDPATGRYLSQDPVGLLGGIALYEYAPDPLLEIDPFGLVFGIYTFIDENTALPYIGSSVDTFRRLGEHMRAERIPNRAVAIETAVDVFGATGRDARRLLRLAEQKAIEAAKKGGRLANQINAIAEQRQPFFDALLKWYKGGQKGRKPTCG